MSRKNKNFVPLLPAILLLPFTFLYYLTVKIRHFFYDTGILSSFKSDVFTVSVGNIAAGGTGKTPVVTEIVSALKDNGIKTAVITRGYGRSSVGRVKVDKNTSAYISGDEPLTIFNKTGADVICDADRVSAAQYLGTSYGAFVLDDAFQHRKIRKHLDIVLLDHDRFLGNGLLLPSGILRDPPSRLSKCDIIILTKIPGPDADSVQKKIRSLKKFKKPVLLSQIRYTHLSNGISVMSPDELRAKKISAFCGIADPEPFFRFFDKFDTVSKMSFKDHCSYGREFDNDLTEMKKESEVIVTTYKDFVKLSEEQINRYNIWYLDIELVFFDEYLKTTEIFDLIKGRMSAEK